MRRLLADPQGAQAVSAVAVLSPASPKAPIGRVCGRPTVLCFQTTHLGCQHRHVPEHIVPQGVILAWSQSRAMTCRQRPTRGTGTNPGKNDSANCADCRTARTKWGTGTIDAKYLMLKLRATDNDAKRRKLSRQIMALVHQHKPGVLSLGSNLCAQITWRVGRNSDKGVTCSWTFEYERAGRRHYLGLGSCNALDPIEVEAAARQQRKLLAEGKDPLTIRREQQAALKAAAAETEAERATAMTFE